MKRKLLLAALVAAGAVGMRAQTDVTSTYIQNAGFEECTAATSNIAAGQNAAGENYESTGWKLAQSSAWSSSAVVAYAGTGQVNGVSAPETDMHGNSGNTLGVSVGWGGTQVYELAEAIRLTAGTYKFSYEAYNANTETGQQTSGNTTVKAPFINFISKSGFVPTSGTPYLSTKNRFAVSHWDTDVIYFTLTEDTEGKFQIGGTAVSLGSIANGKIFFDNLKLEKCVDPTDATVSNPADVTYKVSNFNFDSGTTGWTTTTGASNKGTATNQTGAFNIPFWENWKNSAYTGEMYTTVNELPNGLYEVGISAFVRTLNENCTQYVYANDAKVYLTEAAPTAYTIKGVHVTNGTLKLGLKLDASYSGDNWAGVDNISLTYLGDFIDVTKYVVTNNSFETGDMTGWTVSKNSDDTGVKPNSNNTYKTTGVDGNYLFNTWWQGVPLTQGITELPAGSYQVQALLATSNDDANGKVFLTANDARELYTFPAGTKGTFVETSVTTTLASDGTLTIGAIGGTDAGEYVDGGHWWYKADNFRVSYNVVPNGVLASTLVDKIVASLPTSKMSATVQTELNNAKSTFQASATKANLEALEAAVGEAEASIAVYAEIAATITKLKAQNSSASFTSIDSKYENASYEALSEVFADYNAAAIAALDADATDFTSVIVNPSFEMGDITGWNIDTYGADTGAKDTSNDTYKMTNSVGNYLFNTWTNKVATLDVSQTIVGLPAGSYTVSAVLAGYNDGAVITLYANDITETLAPGSSADTGYRMTTAPVAISEGETLTIKATNTGKGNTFLKADDFILTRYTSANKAAWDVAKANAEVAIANEYYNNVTGEERSTLQSLIDAAEPTTEEGYESAASALVDATTALIDARDAYETLLSTKSFASAYTLEAWPYAAATTKGNLDAAVAVTATSAADAQTAAEAIVTAYRTLVESNAKAGSIDGAVDKTGVIENANAQQGDENAVVVGQAFGWTKGTGMSRKNDEPFTTADGSATMHYFDFWSRNAWAKKIVQKVTIPAGKYILTVTSRASSTLNKFNLVAGDKSVEMTRINADVNTGAFGRGWNDNYLVFDNPTAGSVEIGIDAESTNGNEWMSFSRFRLVKIADIVTVDEGNAYAYAAPETETTNVLLTRSFIDGNWNTLVLPFGMTEEQVAATFGEDVEVAAFTGFDATEGQIQFSTESKAIEANVPVLIKGATDASAKLIEGVTIEDSVPTVTMNGLQFVGTYAAEAYMPVGAFFINKGGEFKKVVKDDTNKIKALRAYFLSETGGEIKGFRIAIDDEIATGIVGLDAVVEDGAYYTIQGIRVDKPTKGLYIHNGKKILVK